MRRAKSLVATGEIELMSTTVLPGESPSATPPGPNSTFSTSGVSGTIVITTSACSAASRPEAHAPPPFSASSDGTALRLCRNNSCPPFWRCPAMGRPIMPSPMKPIFTTVAPCPRLRSCAQIRRDPAKTGRCCGFRLVFAADPSGVALPVERFEQEGVVDLTGAGFVATGVVRNLDVRDPVLQAAVGRQQFSIHALLVVEIELKKGVRRADRVQDGNRLVDAVEMEAWNVLRVDGLYQKPNASIGELLPCEAQVLDEHAPDAVGVDG